MNCRNVFRQAARFRKVLGTDITLEYTIRTYVSHAMNFCQMRLRLNIFVMFLAQMFLKAGICSKGLKTEVALESLDVTNAMNGRQMCLQVGFLSKCFRAYVAQEGLDVTYAVNARQVSRQVALFREELRTNVALKGLDVTNAVNSLHMLMHVLW